MLILSVLTNYSCIKLPASLNRDVAIALTVSVAVATGVTVCQ